MQDLIALRHELHHNPELAGSEVDTARRIATALGELKPDALLEGIGGHGIAATWRGAEDGPHLLFRADLDALPIQETSSLDYRSAVEKVGHLCGHDGHMAILVGLGRILAENPPKRGSATLLFQPAEETGAGGAAVISDPRFAEIAPDRVFALHNLPGFPRGHILVRVGPFACASRGLVVRLHGRTAHAAHPEEAISPALAVAELIRTLSDLPAACEGLRDFALSTVIHARLGEIAFGTTPGEGVVMATLRSALDEDMERLVREALLRVDRIAGQYRLRHEIEWKDEFPATVNHPETTSVLQAAVSAAGLPLEEVEHPFRWSEDVGHFGKIAHLSLFGLGAGEEHPPLHAPDYDFPDAILPVGIQAFEAVLRSYLG